MRAIITSNLNPKLASQALKLKIITLIVGKYILLTILVIDKYSTSVKVIASSDNNVIKKCDCCIIKATILNRGINNIRNI